MRSISFEQHNEHENMKDRNHFKKVFKRKKMTAAMRCKYEDAKM